MALSDVAPSASSMIGVPRAFGVDGVAVEVTPTRLSITAERDVESLATGRFSTPSTGVEWRRGEWPDDIEFLGFAFTQFALPVTSGPELTFDFAPAPGVRSPAALLPLLGRSADRVMLLAPIDSFHEQIIAVTDDGLSWGWHGDLDVVPAGFSSTLGVYEAASITEVLSAWHDDLNLETTPPRHADNVLSTHLSYWTDNGAAYWYRTEPGRTIVESVTAKVDELRSIGVPLRSVELDSWFYDHAIARPIAEIGYPDEVPPTGMLRWEPRSDAFANEDHNDPIAALQQRLDVPLVLHARHIAPESPYVTGADEWWIDQYAAHPQDPAFFRRWFDDARRWGATVIEQDWMQVVWFAIRPLRALPGRADAWQRAMNDHARDTDVDLLWCMATPADLMFAALLDRVVAVRTCDDYRFNDDPAFLWTWFLTANRLAAVLGLPVFKDCFFSDPDAVPEGDAIDADRHAELEAALAALSGGPVGIGDRLARTNRDIVMRCCDDDGRLRRLDGPIAAIDRCMFGAPGRGDMALWSTTTATTAEGAWTYLLAINTTTTRSSIDDTYELAERSTVFDWRAGIASELTTIDVNLAPGDWALFVVSPQGEASAADRGDPSRYVVVEAER